MTATKCKCGKGYGSEVDGICKFCREKKFHRSQGKKVGVRTRGDGMTLTQAQQLQDGYPNA